MKLFVKHKQDAYIVCFFILMSTFTLFLKVNKYFMREATGGKKLYTNFSYILPQSNELSYLVSENENIDSIEDSSQDTDDQCQVAVNGLICILQQGKLD